MLCGKCQLTGHAFLVIIPNVESRWKRLKAGNSFGPRQLLIYAERRMACVNNSRKSAKRALVGNDRLENTLYLAAVTSNQPLL